MSELAPVIIVTGTGTGVGKTVTTAAVVVGLRAQGLRVVVAKPAQTGLLPNEPGDLHEVCRLAGDIETHEFVRLPDPLAPDAAGRLAGVELPTVAEHASRLVEIAGRDDVDLVLVEGAGGLLVRIDADACTIADLGSELTAAGAKVGFVVVAAAGLGTLNHSALTAEALRARGLDCLGFVIGSWPADPDLAMRTNLVDMTSVTGTQLLGRVPAGAGHWDPTAFQANASGWIAIT
ncbi:MAG: dethiobiotin synthetase [Actinomycetota bacterium]|jgi:dethiobiotin synthetase|nr:dethiobiotin synthetase [Actinomycetota bacterium]